MLGHCLVSLLESAATATERVCPVCRDPISSASPNYAVRQLSTSSPSPYNTTDIDDRLRRIISIRNNHRGGGGTSILYFDDYKIQVATGVAVALYLTIGFGLPPELLYWMDNASVVICTILVLSYVKGNPLLG